MKKIIILMSLIICFFGCGREKYDITLYTGGAPNELDVWQSILDEFETEYGIKVKLVRQPTDSDMRRQGLTAPLQAEKNEPDVFLMDIAWLPQFAYSGWLEPLDPYIEKDNPGMSGFFEGILKDVCTFNGNLMAIPVSVDGGLLYYRKDIFEEEGIKGPPETWKELVDICTATKEKYIDAGIRWPVTPYFLWQGAQYEGLVCNFLEFITSNNGNMDIKNGKMDLDTPENIRALQFMSDLINKYEISPENTFTEMKEEHSRIAFEQSRGIFMRNWPYAWGIYNKKNNLLEGKVGIAPLPSFKNGKSASALGGWHAGISAYSEKKEESYKLLSFLASYGVQKGFVITLGWNPGRKDVYEDAEVLLKDVFENAAARPMVPYYTAVSDVLQPYLNAAISGEKTPAEALEQAEREVNEVIRRYTEG
ncbi:MAG: ABC transporter substrate-binding protein [bacterium]